MHITPYEKGNIFNKDPLRPKKLLLHKKEIEKLSSKTVSYTHIDVYKRQLHEHGSGAGKLTSKLCIYL